MPPYEKVNKIIALADELEKVPANASHLLSFRTTTVAALREIADELAWIRSMLEPVK